MRAAAQLHRIGFHLFEIIAHAKHAHFIAIFLAEQSFGARGNGLVGWHQPRGRVGILPDHFVHLRFNPLQFLRRHGLGMREIETQPLR
jgi:hypothetical protein